MEDGEKRKGEAEVEEEVDEEEMSALFKEPEDYYQPPPPPTRRSYTRKLGAKEEGSEYLLPDFVLNDLFRLRKHLPSCKYRNDFLKFIVWLDLLGSHPLWGHFLWNAAIVLADHLDQLAHDRPFTSNTCAPFLFLPQLISTTSK